MSDTATAPEPNTRSRIIQLTERKRQLDAELRAVKAELAPLHEQMLAELIERGESSVRDTETGKLVYINRRTWARPVTSKDEAYDALIAAGLESYAERGFNTTSLSAYFGEEVKRRQADGDPVDDVTELLPEQLRGVIELTTDHTIGVRG